MTTLFNGAFAHRPVIDAEEPAHIQQPSSTVPLIAFCLRVRGAKPGGALDGF
jgi:hypothetical protein